MEEEDRQILNFVQNKKRIILLNKIDLGQTITEDIFQGETVVSVSVKQNIGFDKLVQQLKKLFFEGEIHAEYGILGNVRHRNALYQAKEAMHRALITITTRMPEDFISMDLQEANTALGEITGDTVDEEIIDRIFTKFCLGK